ncbi:MAG: helix-turn-helix transcriptional regulator [Flavobacteriales bacterium]|nr:helix-turn-helix transcriptional regulator [Flavobacteriales bacterium]
MDEQEFLEKLGQRIAELRKAKGMTQFEFAEKLDMQRTALTRIETGNVNTTILTLKSICDLLDIDLCQLTI